MCFSQNSKTWKISFQSNKKFFNFSFGLGRKKSGWGLNPRILFCQIFPSPWNLENYLPQKSSYFLSSQNLDFFFRSRQGQNVSKSREAFFFTCQSVQNSAKSRELSRILPLPGHKKCLSPLDLDFFSAQAGAKCV